MFFEKHAIRRLALLAAAAFLATAAGSAAKEGWSIQTANRGAAQMVLTGGRTGDVPFPHDAHQGAMAECTPCHSLFPQEKGSIERLKAEGGLKPKEVMKDCQKCHRQKKKAGEKSGPVGCKDCHSVK